jgi:hypothetical protein
MAISRGCYGSERDAPGIYDRGSFDALFAPVYGISACLLAATGSLGDAAIDGYVSESCRPMVLP